MMYSSIFLSETESAPLRAAALALFVGALTGCIVHERCYDNKDCPEGQLCQADGTCGVECVSDTDCGGFPFVCDAGACALECVQGELSCPADMVPVCSAYCIDHYEASRQDATATSGGSDATLAVSQAGVIPWYSNDAEAGMNQSIAAAACEAAGKRLCTPQEWQVACSGLDDLVYTYGDDYDPATCNSIDTFCDCDGDGEPDGDAAYPHCRQECDTDFHVEPTGTFPQCVGQFGAMDINGNVWEVVDEDDGVNHYRGGAYNCGDSETLHRCDYDGKENGNFPSAKGFRCCADGEAL